MICVIPLSPLPIYRVLVNPWQDTSVLWLLRLAAHEDTNLNGYTKRGLKKRKKKGEVRIIQNLYNNGMKPQDIANHLGMHMAEIQRILQLSYEEMKSAIYWCFPFRLYIPSGMHSSFFRSRIVTG